MSVIVRTVESGDIESLVDLRITAMRESLERVGRFDPSRARKRFLDSFCAEGTRKVLINDELVAFYMLVLKSDHYYLNHFYVHPDYQNRGVGSEVLQGIKSATQSTGLPIRLCALKQSRSNLFYKRYGFEFTHEDEWDNYYEFTHL